MRVFGVAVVDEDSGVMVTMTDSPGVLLLSGTHVGAMQQYAGAASKGNKGGGKSGERNGSSFNPKEARSSCKQALGTVDGCWIGDGVGIGCGLVGKSRGAEAWLQQAL